ncbi:RNA binding protein, heterogenous nuclear RNP-K like protein [Coelomomyces lativittatus]|nr:RNA binding protein, heterogenous nuclear RNP-K like protein [Coelomomyces lativittatus]KAJ1500093.1 RNA binding protein, heterogenous nuclear RNP-K like protein [Coelomomyces lativittatus]
MSRLDTNPTPRKPHHQSTTYTSSTYSTPSVLPPPTSSSSSRHHSGHTFSPPSSTTTSSSTSSSSHYMTASDHLTLRALVGMKEAGIVIGKGGSNIKAIRDASNARVAVSEHVPGVPERVLSITGAVDEVAKV